MVSWRYALKPPPPPPQSPRVSVIIPTHNRAALLPRAVNSVLAQTCQDFEILIVDDCSADDTPQVAAAFADPRICSFRHDANRGLSAALNTGIANARGAYVAFLEDDDEFTPNSLADRLAPLESAPPEVALSYGYMDVTDDVSGERWPGRRFTLEGAEAFEFSLKAEALAGMQGMLVRTPAAREVGGFDERLSLGADALFMCSILAKYRIVAVPTIIALAHHQHGHSQISSVRNWVRMLKHHEVHRQRFAAEIDQRPGLRRYLERDLPAHWMGLAAVYAMRQGAVLTSLGFVARTFKANPLTAKHFRLLLHLVKGFLFYATPLRRLRRPLQRLLGQRNR